MKYAFIDGENLPNLITKKEKNFKSYEKIFHFHGKKQEVKTQMNLCVLPLIQIQCDTIAKNNLDYHLIFTLGKMHENTPKTVTFHLFSKDKGFDNICQFLKSQGRICERLEGF